MFIKSIKRDYKENFQFLGKIKYYIWFSFFLFMLSAASGYFFVPEEVSQKMLDSLKEEFSKFGNYSSFYLFLLIFLNNYIKATISSLSSFLLALPALFMLIMNGLILGMFFPKESFINSSGEVLGKVDFMKGVLPHGILELWLIFVATAISFYFTVEFFKSYRKEKKFQFKKRFWFLLKFNLLFLMPLFVLAAFIEAYITPMVMAL